MPDDPPTSDAPDAPDALDGPEAPDEPVSPATTGRAGTSPSRGGAFTPPGGGPSPLPVMTLLLVSALLAAVGIVLVARSGAPAAGRVLLALGVIGALTGVIYAVRNVQRARSIERAGRRDRTES